MAQTCTYTLRGPDGENVVLRGMAAIKAFLATGGLEYLRAPEVRRSSERDLDGFRRELLARVQTNMAMAEMRSAAHEWALNVGDKLLSTATGKIYTLTGRTFQRVGPIKNNDWQPVYSYSTGEPPPASATREERDAWDKDYEQGTFREKAILESKTLKSLTTPIMRSAERPWYSQLERAIESVPARLDNMAAPAWQQWLKANAAKLGVKQDEITWSGIEDFLKLKGKEKVSKAEIGEYLGANGVSVEEVMLAGRAETNGTGWDEDSGSWAVFDRAGALVRSGFADESAAARWMRETYGESGPTKYANYTLPGGERYRELLLTLPEKEPDFSIDDFIDEMAKKYGKPAIYDIDGVAHTIKRAFPKMLSAEDQARYAEVVKNKRVDPKPYKSSHWDQPNILAHIRVNDRVDADGKRVLFVEEIQSDWGQAAKKRGIKPDAPPARQVEPDERDSLVSLMRLRAQDKMVASGIDSLQAKNVADRLGQDTLASLVGMNAEYEDLVRREGLDRQASYNYSNAVPAAPFVTATDKWLSLALKRVIKLAVDETLPGNEAWAQVTKPQRIREELEQYFGPELAAVLPLEVVDTAMLGATENDKVRRAVVQAIPVDVMNILADNSFSAEELVRQPDVVGKRLPVVSRSAVARGLADSLALVGARSRAVLRGVLTGEMAGRDGKLDPAISARDFEPNVVVRLLSGASSSQAGAGSGSAAPSSAGLGAKAREPSLDGAREGRELSPAQLAEALNRHDAILRGAEGNVVSKYVAPSMYEKIAFVTGEQSAERYDLSKQIDSVEYIPKLRRLQAWKDGLSATNVKDVVPEKLEDYIGKEAAKRLLESPIKDGRHILSGLDLKVGGEGMKIFYDSLVPQVARDVLKRVGGGAMETVAITNADEGRDPEVVEHPGYWQYAVRDRKTGDYYDSDTDGWISDRAPTPASKSVAEKWAKAIREDGAKGALQQPGFTITDTMREKAAGGMPLFSRERDADQVYKEMASDEDLIAALETYMVNGDAPEGALNDRLVAYMGRLPPVPADSYLTFYRNQPSWGKPWERGWASWTTNEDQTRFFGGTGFEVLKRKGVQGVSLERLGEERSRLTGEYHQYGSQAEWLVLNDSVFSADAIRSRERGPRTETPEFKAWSGGATLVRMGEARVYKSGEPVVVEALHGTTNAGLSEFSRRRANIESDFGAGFYASNTPEDVATNYANTKGPDLTAKRQRLAEKIVQDLEDDPDWAGRDDIEREIEARERADAQLTEMAPNTLKLYLRFRNPAVLGGKGETFFDYNEEYDEETDGYGEPTGGLVDFVNALDEVGDGVDLSMRDLEQAKAAIWEAAGSEGLSLAKLAEIVKEKLVDAYGTESGDSASSELLRQALQGAGFDGVIDTTVAKKFKNMKGMTKDTAHFIAFEPAQLKSAIGNDGSFDETDPNILSSASRAWATPGASKFDDVVYKMQDKQVDLKRIVEAVKGARGEIRNDLDTYLQEELFHGRAAKRTEDFVNKELQPLVDEMAKRGLTIEDLDEYLHARHAPEANRLIAERNPDSPLLQDGGSGLDTQTALQYMADLPADKRDHLAAAAAKVDGILDRTRKLVVDYELEGKDTVNGWGEMFEHYVPLMREDDGDAPQRLGTGQGFSIKGREVKSRTGSTKKVVDILANIAMQRERTIVRGEKNRVAQSLVGLAKANPNKDFWTVDLTPMTPTFDPKKGVVVQRPDPMFKARPNVVVAKIREEDGSVKEHAVIFSEKDGRALRTATALKNLDAAQLEGLMGASAHVTRYFAAVNTQYNPVFGVVNLVRDVQGAMINLQTTELAGKQKEVAKNTLSALRGIYSDARAVRGGKSATSAWASLWEDFQDVGGQTGFRQLFATSNDRAEAIQKALNPDAWMDSKLGKIFTARGTLRVPLAVAMKGARWIFDLLSDYNLAMENGIRLATYKAGLDAGMSKERAASVAKNLTVNFNRKGQVGQQAGAVYAFFNASMQGTARLGQVLFDMEPGKPKTIRLSGLGKRVVYGGVMLGSFQALALAAAGFDDNDPPDFLRERALIIPTGGKTYISIPMPLGFHVIPGIGRMTTEWALSGFKDTPQRTVKMLGMFADTFNPIGNAGLSMQTLAPTALDPLIALTENKDWQGRPIAKESYNKATPGHMLSRDTDTAWARMIAEAVNVATGGNEYVAGAISPVPSQIDYLIGQITGGVGREISKAEQTAKTAVTGEELPLYKIPLVGRFVGNAGSQASEGSAFYANTDALNRLETEVKGLQKDGRMAEAAALRASRPDAYLMAQANQAERQIAKLRKQKSELVKDGAPRERIRAIEEQITARMAALNRAAESLREKAGS